MVGFALYCYYVNRNCKAQRSFMHIISIGLNHSSAPIHLRERLAFDEEQIRASLARLACGQIVSSLAELIIRSTCNRIELYAASNELAFAELEAFLLDARA